MDELLDLIDRLKHETANPDTSGAPYVNDPELLLACLKAIERLSACLREMYDSDGESPEAFDEAADLLFGSYAVSASRCPEKQK